MIKYNFSGPLMIGQTGFEFILPLPEGEHTVYVILKSDDYQSPDVKGVLDYFIPDESDYSNYFMEFAGADVNVFDRSSYASNDRSSVIHSNGRFGIFINNGNVLLQQWEF